MFTTVDVHYAISSITCESYIYSIRIMYSKLWMRLGERENTNKRSVSKKARTILDAGIPTLVGPGLSVSDESSRVAANRLVGVL